MNLRFVLVLYFTHSGDTWQIKRKLLLRFPETLLGSPALENYWRSDLKCYFFDRNRYPSLVDSFLCLQEELTLKSILMAFCLFKPKSPGYVLLRFHYQKFL